MTDHRLLATWLRPLVGSFALAGALLLSACGGGSGAPNNPYAPIPAGPGPLTILPLAATIYSGIPATLAVTGGIPPYRAFSSNTAVLPVAQSVAGGTILLLGSNVGTDTNVTITVQDSAATVVTSAITLKAAPLVNGLTITPNSAACGINSVCSGQTATASVTVLGPEGGVLPNRQVRFDVVQGAFAIQTNNPAQPLASTLTVVSDANGLAQVIIQATANAATQPALLRATDLTSGNQVTGQFTIVQTINGAAVLSVVPATATITSASAVTCTSGFRVDYFIYGGTPPYRVTTTFPDGVILVNSTVATSGGSFEAITNGTCVNPLVFSIFDSVGLQTTATLINQVGTAPPAAPPAARRRSAHRRSPRRPAPPPPISHSSFRAEPRPSASPYRAVAPPRQIRLPRPRRLPSISAISTAGSGLHTILVGDASTPQQTTSATITCP